MIRVGFILVLLFAPLLCASADAFEASVRSPNESLAVYFALNENGEPIYNVTSNGKPLILRSRLGFEPNLLGGFAQIDTKQRAVRETWQFAFGERSKIPDNYNELTIALEHESGVRIDVVMRAYDEGTAIRYQFPKKQNEGVKLQFGGEHTEFRLPAGTKGYEEHGTEGPYQLSLVSEIRPYCERPLTIMRPDGGCAAICEAGNIDYARMMLSPLEGVDGALVSALGGRTTNTENEHQRHDSSVSMRPGEATPWRLLLVGDTPGKLLENNYPIFDSSIPELLS